VFLLVMPPQL